MGTIADKLTYLTQTKEEIRTAIQEKGVEVSADTAFREYPQRISQIKTGDPLPDKIIYYNNMNGTEYIADGYQAKQLKRVSGDPSVYTWEPLDLTATWADSAVSVCRPSSGVSHGIAIQRSRSNWPDSNLDNGFGSGCPGFTIGGWFCRTKTYTSEENRALYVWGPPSTYYYFGVYTYAGEPTYLAAMFHSTHYGKLYPIEYNKWYHIALSFEQTESGVMTMTMYVNADVIASYSADYTIDFESIMLCNLVNSWGGYMKNAFASWGVLTREEIRKMMLKD